ncbi:zinc ribbon domain-containing protein [Ruegeria arenilitoris]|uniref:zinc ribbon domain-containing protein n=1 Tax=Ruegeria arenilitoris TaxID=1173585 RepID=UPI0020C2372C|nr:zinc ribbon domain-containing protein [Ruegeria arenilitoris]
MLTCGCCGGGVIQVGKQYYGCSTQRNKGTCDNRLTIKRADLEDRVLSGLKEQLLHPNLIAEFAKAYQEEYNRLAGSIQQERSNATRGLAQVEHKISHLIDAISDGMFHASMKDKLTALEVRKSELQDTINSASDEPPVLLHPGLSDVYRKQVANLTTALRDPSSQAEATCIIRGLLSEIRLIPDDGTYTIELVGELAGLLALGAPQNEQSRPEAACSGLCSPTLVAGAGFEPATFRL